VGSKLLIQICDAEGINILKGVVSPDHIHMHIEYRPSQNISTIVKKFKGRSSMKLKIITLVLLFYLSVGFAQKKVHISIKTTVGAIEVELYPAKAPKTVENFLKYVSKGLYDNDSFFRVCTAENEADRKVKIEVIQGGDVAEGLLFQPIELETTQETGLKHLNGTISMARGAPNSAQSSFFICINKQPSLDFGGERNSDRQGFAAFGMVSKGMNVVLKIQASENVDQYITAPITIKTIEILPPLKIK